MFVIRERLYAHSVECVVTCGTAMHYYVSKISCEIIYTYLILDTYNSDTQYLRDKGREYW